jgi:hypothetical protein
MVAIQQNYGYIMKLWIAFVLIFLFGFNKTHATDTPIFACIHEVNGVMEPLPYHFIYPGEFAACPNPDGPIEDKFEEHPGQNDPNDHSCILHRVAM